MGIFSKFEGRVEDTFEGAANKMFDSPLSPVQIAKKAEKKMRREKMVGAGKQYAPTLYTVLVNASDDQKLFGYYPTLAGETETYLAAKAMEEGLALDGQPLVRFIVDNSLKRGKFDIIAELVASPIISQLRAEEMDRYGIGSAQGKRGQAPRIYPPQQQGYAGQRSSQPHQVPSAPPIQPAYQQDYGDYAYENDYGQQDQTDRPPLPYVPENEIDYSIDYGEYTFDSQDFESYQQNDAKVPNTAVFVSGSGNASPLPNPSMVKASLLNATDNRTYNLASARLLLGRESTNDIVVDDINTSRIHAELRLESEGVWVIADLGSTNGTLVNGREISSQVLKDGDYLTIGMTNFVFIQA